MILLNFTVWVFFHQVGFMLFSRQDTFFATIIAVLRHKKNALKPLMEKQCDSFYSTAHAKHSLTRQKNPKKQLF